MVYVISNDMDKVQRELLFSTFHNKNPHDYLVKISASRYPTKKRFFGFVLVYVPLPPPCPHLRTYN